MCQPGALLRGAFDRLGRFPVIFFGIVVIAAGASGVALLVAPGSTDRYFSWTLRPPSAAALIGGFYLASAIVFAWALTLTWQQARPLVVGVLGLAVPTLVLTLVYDDVFDFGRWQAGAWVALFVMAPVSATAMLVVNGPGGDHSPPVPRWCRAALGLVAIALVALAVSVWANATRGAVVRASPVDLVRLTGTYLGAWCSFLAVLCGYAVWTGRWTESRPALVTLGVASAGAGLAFIRVLGEIRHPVAALGVPACVAVAAIAMYVSSRPPTSPGQRRGAQSGAAGA